MDPHPEQVLGIARASVPDLEFRGVRSVDVTPYLNALNDHGEFRPRDAVESDPSFKQAIPYLVLRDGERIFLMRRTRAGGDGRLHDRYTIGIGGHVNPGDGDIIGGLRREWREEIEADFDPELRPIGILNDDENPVGAVHLGVVFSADANGRSVAIRERHKLEGSFATIDDVAAVADRLETWSALLFEFLTAGLPESDG